MNWKKHRHYGRRAVIAILLSSAVTPWLLDYDSTVSKILNVSTTIALLVSLMLSAAHSHGSLCEKCMTEMPLNAPELAERKHRILRFAHSIYGDGKRYLIVMTSFLASVVAAMLLTEPDTDPSRAFGTITALLVSAALYSSEVHQRFSPWCPWCRRPGGGEDEEVVTPDPVQPEKV